MEHERRFKVAVSFAGAQRSYVEQLVATLREKLPREQVFYDRDFPHEIVTPDMDLKLAAVYRDQSEVVVACLSAEYAEKKWTAHEGRAIRDLTLAGDGDRVVFLRFDNAVVPGLFEISGRLHADKLTLDEVVEQVLLRCALVESTEWKERRQQATAPLDRPNNLPYDSIGTLFKGREQFLDDLRQQLNRQATRAAAIVQKQAIHGLGGVGKTRLAVEYGWRYRGEYSALLFVIAESAEALRRNLAGLCRPSVLNLPEQEAREEEKQVAAVLRWIEQHPGWFLIFDNVDTEDAAHAVEDLLPRLQGGHALITSRLSHWSTGIEPVELDVLTEAASVAFLLERTAAARRRAAHDEQHARELAQELDGLALALEQAGAYVAVKHCSLGDYLQRWRARDQIVREWFDERQMKYPRSVAVTWDTSMEQLDVPARALLELLSWMAPEPIPTQILASEQAARILQRYVANRGSALHEDKTDPQDALATLVGYSLAKLEGGNDRFRVHRLVQEVTRLRIEDQRRHASAQSALELVSACAPSRPDDAGTWPTWDMLLPHARRVTDHDEAAQRAEPLLFLMNQLAILLHTKALYTESERLYRRALAIAEHTYDQHHSAIAAHLSNLGGLLRDTNRPGEAEPLLWRALAIYERSFGPGHPDVAIGLNNLAALLRMTNRLEEAEPLYRRALAIDQDSYGPDHPEVATDLNNLALLVQETNRPEEAEPLCRRALAIDERAFGCDHPKVGTRLNNLAELLRTTERLEEAEPLYRRALAIYERWYGPDHPDVATCLNNIALLLQATDRLAEAEPLLRRAIGIYERSLGIDNPRVATAFTNLGLLLAATKRHADAEFLFRRALAIDEHSFGPEHFEVATDLNNLAGFLQNTGRLTEAEPLFHRALMIFQEFRRTTGHEHPHMRQTLANYWTLLRRTGVASAEIERRLRERLEQ